MSNFAVRIKPFFAVFTVLFAFNLQAQPSPNELLDLPIPLISKPDTSLAQFMGKKPVYLKFWASWCQPCRKEMPHFQRIKEQYGDSIEVIGINLGMNDDIGAVKSTMAEFGLTMPTAIDQNGDLAQAFRLTGTPYHLLFDSNMKLVHRGHQASEILDNKLGLLSQTKPVELLGINALQETEEDVDINTADGKLHALFFTATWCDWYLKDSRPAVSKNCTQAQRAVNSLYRDYPKIGWHGVISRLWTGEKDLIAYQRKYDIALPVKIDKSNRLFHKHTVKTLPTLILLKDNQVVARLTDFNNMSEIRSVLNDQ